MFDPKTAILLTIIGTLLMSGGLFSISRGYLGQIDGVAQWAKATLLQSAGWIITGALRGVLPEVISITLGQGMILLSLAFYLLILAKFNHHRIHSSWVFAVVAIEVVLLAYFGGVQPNLNVRIIIISVCSAPLLFASVYVLLTQGAVAHVRSASQLFTAGLYLLCGTFMLIRGGFYLFYSPQNNQPAFGQNTMNDVSYIIFFIIALGLTFSFLLMCNERYVQQRQTTDLALQENHERFAKFALQVPGVVYQYQLFPDGRSCFPFASSGIQEIYEVTPEQVQHDASAVLAVLHPDDLSRIVDSINESARSMRPWSLEFRVRLPKQGLRWRRGDAQPELLLDGSVLWHGFITDITEQAFAKEKQRQLEAAVRAGFEALKISEARLRRLMNSSLIGILQGDVDGRLVEANDVILQMTGHTRAELDSGQLNWLQMSADQAQAQQTLADLRQAGSAPQFACEIVAQDGSKIPIMLGLALLDINTQEWVGFVLDLREQHRIDKLKAEFISVVSHELRTPLTSIRGSLGLLEAGVAGQLPENALKLIHIAHKNSQRLMALVNDILDMEKLASGKMTLHLQALDLFQIAQQAVEANTGYAQSFQVSYQLENLCEKTMVLADIDRLMQVFANLLSNAAKFSPSGETVLVRLLNQDARIRVEVEDHGRGIPSAFHAHIFGKFAQADATTSRHVEGAGLGLHITKTLIEKMRGEIGFRSEEGKGSVFWFDLPLLDAAAQAHKLH